MPVNVNKLTESQKDMIEGIVRYRFFHRISVRNVYDWLRNFRQDEVDLALEILKHVDYYREDDIINILEGFLSDDISKENLTLHFVPIGKAGKSGQIMVYIIQGVLKYNKALKNRVRYYTGNKDFDVMNLSMDDVVYLVDDVVGSGNTFDKFVRENNEVSQLFEDVCPATVKLLSIVVTETGKNHLETKYPALQIVGEVKKKAFDTDNSLFGSYYKMLPVREFAYKYGKKLSGRKCILGYDNSQLLVVFSHTVPNNTLPIIWKGNQGFHPLIPRSYLEKSKKAFLDRNETNRWIYFFMNLFPSMERQQVAHLFQDKEVINMMTLLRLKLSGLDEVVIANHIGLHFQDMEKAWAKGTEMRLWDESHHPTEACLKRYAELKKRINFENTEYSRFVPRTESDETVMYIPGTFRGLT